MAMWWMRGWAGTAMVVALGMGASGVGWTTDVWAQAPQWAQLSDPAVAQSADLTVMHRRVKADGTPYAAQAPAVSMHVERRLESGRWRSTFVFRDVERPTTMYGDTEVSLAHPFRVARVDVDEATGEATVFDARGRTVPMPTAADRERLSVDPKLAAAAGLAVPGLSLPAGHGARPWQALGPGDFVARLRDVADRRRDLVAKFGSATGQVRGLDRFVRVMGSETTEVLVRPDIALPVEVNVVSSGVLRSHTEIRYAALGTVGHVRDLVRTERALGGGSTGRLITDVRFSNVVVSTGGRP